MGLVVGSIAAAVFAATMALGLPQALAAILAVAAMVWLSGGLHEDGLADLADGMGGPNRERRLEIMRDSRIGSYGALTLGLVTAIRITALAVLPVPAAIGAFLLFPRCRAP
ncbi:adenosylcobinamide-GDP ribazoletransferase [Paracoccus cavernae]|uniref:Adenosylcobinamide-GDP ribazoletransferase n=1 Tax=Paracoccus cavernae TaxID=1571207 RepID=A0ABT8D3I6_9RHOB|nr:adenosylcobinamide-GDP ribazoletransferase [Paracoccus cavernae]